MILQRNKIEKYNERRRDTNDRRRFVAWGVFSYIDPSGVEYRKVFTAPAGTPEAKFWTIAPKTIEQ